MTYNDPESLGVIRRHLTKLVAGVNHDPDLPLEDKVRAVRGGLLIMGQTWDPVEGPLWSEMIEHLEAGHELTDEYLIDWRHRYRMALGIG